MHIKINFDQRFKAFSFSKENELRKTYVSINLLLVILARKIY